ncbi:hypothetical protein ACMXYX_04895 [Neptuniibacter sp. QD72_48]|uniref:hypothetical protein n=1 Tax=unclassified Neptuniibacter TaxID=2630693 RepID=UPI0039F4971C
MSFKKALSFIFSLFFLLPGSYAYGVGTWDFDNYTEFSAVFILLYLIGGWIVSIVLLIVVPVYYRAKKPESFKKACAYMYGGHIAMFGFILIDSIS